MSTAISTRVQCSPSCQRAARGSVFSRLFGIQALWRSRQRLATLDQSRLDDIGLTQQQADAEARKGIWDVPAHWTK